MQSVVFTNRQGEKLAGSLHRPVTPSPTGVVLGHCFTCSRHTRVLTDLCEMFAEIGFAALRFDFSGNGQSQGRFEDATYSKQVDEMRCAVQFLQELGVEKVLIGGHSMGAVAALFAAVQAPFVVGVIALGVGAKPLSPDRLLDTDQQETLAETGMTPIVSRGRNLVVSQAFFTDAADYRLENALSGIGCPVLVVLAADDRITDPAPVKTICRPYPQVAVTEIAEADHMFLDAVVRQAAVAQVRKWIGNHFDGGI